MTGFFIHSSNCLEESARLLAAFMGEKKSVGVLDPEVVVVPSRALERWLKLYLARVNGISANLEFPFPQAFLEETVLAGLRCQIDPGIKANPFLQESLAWKIFFALDPDRAPDPGRFPELDHYLAETGDELSRYHLAQALADLFDRYLLARPELIRAWERGENPLSQRAPARWQKDLWCALGRGQAKVHFAALHERLNEMLYPEFFPQKSSLSINQLSTALPARLFLFGFATLPFSYFDIFKGLSRLTEVHLFHCNPCAEYWGDQYGLSRPKSYLQSAPMPSETGSEEPAGHPLLASWGRLGRAFFDLAAALEVAEYNEHFVVPEGNTLLALLQRQILFLEPPRAPIRLAEGDCSLQIHRSHGLKREVEILYDTILAALERDPALEPDDILVMAPDIDLYAPYIEALFAQRKPLADNSSLPFSLATSKAVLRQPVIRAFFDLLRLIRSRYHLSEVFDLFCQESVCRRFSVTESGLALLREWLQKAAVNWGLDGTFRQENLGLDFAEHSFAWGLDRLLAGYGLAGNGLNSSGFALDPEAEVWPYGSEDLSAAPGFSPLPGIEGSEALVLGSFCAFITALSKTRQGLLKALPVSRWRVELESLIADFIQPATTDNGDLLFLRQAINNLCLQLENGSGLTADASKDYRLSTETISTALEKSLGESLAGAGFFAGGINFSSILPLRALPAKMICLLGLNDGDFPRSPRPPAYDLIALVPRAGDRNARDEDRYLFLETLLAARQTLVLSYIGRDPKDNHLRPPSILLSELLDYIEVHFAVPLESDAESLRDLLLYDHPPQPFSPRYFQTGGDHGNADRSLFSYNRVAAAIAAGLSQENRAKPDFLGPPLAISPPERLELSDLLRFFASPARYFLHERLKVVPEISSVDQFADSEPFALDALDSYQLYDEIIDCLLATPAVERSDPAFIETVERRLAGAGKLPLRASGRVVFADKFKTAIAMTARLTPFCTEVLSPLQETVVLALAEGEVEILIRLDDLYRGEDGIIRQVLYRPAKAAKDKDLLRSAILHLGLELATVGASGDSQKGVQETRFYALTDKNPLVLTVREKSLAQAEMAALYEVFVEGLRRPLPFLPALSRPWYETFIKEAEKTGLEKARAKAREKVRGLLASENNFDVQDEAFQFCFQDKFEDDAFWADFENLAQHLGPLFDVC